MSRIRHYAAALVLASCSAAFGQNLFIGSAFNTVDTDGDGIPDFVDNAPYIGNPDQADNDADGLGNAADAVPNFTDPDGDGVIDFIDAQTQNSSVTSITYTLGGPYFVFVGQNLAVTYSASATSDPGFDRLSISVDGVPNVATYILTPSAPAITLSGTDLANLGINTPGPHTFGVKSFYNYAANEYSLTTITVVAPEPVTLSAALLLPTIAIRHRR